MTRAPLLVLAVSAALALAGTGCGGPIQSDELGRSVDTLTSSASEGALLAQGVADDRTKATFVRARAREIGEVVDHEAEKLNDAEADGLAGAKSRAVLLADRIGAALGQLQVSPQDEQGAAQVERELARLSKRTERLAGSL